MSGMEVVNRVTRWIDVDEMGVLFAMSGIWGCCYMFSLAIRKQRLLSISLLCADGGAVYQLYLMLHEGKVTERSTWSDIR